MDTETPPSEAWFSPIDMLVDIRELTEGYGHGIYLWHTLTSFASCQSKWSARFDVWVMSERSQKIDSPRHYRCLLLAPGRVPGWSGWSLEIVAKLFFSKTRRVDGSADISSHRSLTVYSASRSHSACVWHQGMHAIDSRPFRSMTIRPPIPEIQIDLQNSRSKVKLKGTSVSAASFWLTS